jgi:type III restriction enzyme
METLTLLDFQTDIAHRLHGGLFYYRPEQHAFPADVPNTEILRGEERPFVAQIKAVTGAGKTPMLAYFGSLLRGSVILWTTPRSAVISQTLQTLQTRYNNLLAPDTQIFDLSNMSDNEWSDTIERGHGVTILVATVGSFNQDGDALRLHRGEPSRWQELKWHRAGGLRRRPLYVFYDEGHNATERQFGRLLDLRPSGFIIAGASALTKDLYTLLPGETDAAKLDVFNSERLFIVKTQKVVEAGLLKREIELFDLDAPWTVILGQAIAKREYLATVSPQPPIMCAIVKRTEHGIDVWREMVRGGVPPEKIGVHLANASETMRRINSGELPGGFKDTYSESATPEDLRQAGYTHLIWNMTLQEGWDEPWAYVAYLHDPENSVTEIEQKIGRFIRNPFKDANGLPVSPEHPDLAKAYFYFNAANDLLRALLDSLKASMTVEGYEVLHLREAAMDRVAVEVDLLTAMSVPRVSLQVKDPERMADDFISGLIAALTSEPIPNRQKPGTDKHGNLDLFSMNATDEQAPSSMAVSMTVGQAIRAHFENYDWRFVKSKGSTGSWLSPTVWAHSITEIIVDCGSDAYTLTAHFCRNFAAKAHDYLVTITEPDSEYRFTPVKLSNPDGGDDETSRAFYAVRSFKNSIHPQYNGLKKHELALAEAIDATGLRWARNPCRTGYGIPAPRATGRNNHVFPGFVVWHGSGILLIDVTPDLDTIRQRMFEVPPGLNYIGLVGTEETEGFGGFNEWVLVESDKRGGVGLQQFCTLGEALLSCIRVPSTPRPH